MPLPYPINRYRPTRVPDGDSGFTETLGTPAVVYGIIEANKSETTAIFDMYDDVKIGDVLGVTPEESSTEALYRVKTSARILDTTAKEVSLERMDRPVSP